MGKDEDRDEDIDLFRKAMEGVNRTSRKYQHSRHQGARKIPETGTRNPRKPVRPDLPAYPVSVDQTTDSSSVLFVRSGIQKKVIRRLKRGDLLPQHNRSELDLHGARAREAEEMLESFIAESMDLGHSCVLVIHGKGFRSADSRGVIKPLTIDWLRNAVEVMAFCSAQPRDGGTGAAYVLLKRPPE